jgi:hypothetical protein
MGPSLAQVEEVVVEVERMVAVSGCPQARTLFVP